jgi:hypothetical protein
MEGVEYYLENCFIDPRHGSNTGLEGNLINGSREASLRAALPPTSMRAPGEAGTYL